MIFSLGGGSSGGKLNYEVIGSLVEPANPSENMIWVNTDVKIPLHAFDEVNPFIAYKDVELAGTAEIDNGYLNTSGGIASQSTTNLEQYTIDYIPVQYKKNYEYKYTLSVSKSMWLAIGEYTLTSSGAYSWSKRTVPVNGVTGVTQTGTYTPSSESVVAVRLAWRTFGDASCNISFAEKNVMYTIEGTPNGTVWFRTQETSRASFNMLKENELYIYPVDCHQYINNEWAPFEAKTYDYSYWKDWVYYLYNKGNTYESVTGGWTTGKKGWDSEAVSGLTPTLTFEDEYLSIYHKTSNYGGGYARLTNMIDLTNYSTLVLEGSFIATRTTNRLFIWASMGTYLPSNAAAYVNLSTLTDINKIELDISSLSGEHYIGFGMYSVSGTYADIQISKMYLR